MFFVEISTDPFTENLENPAYAELVKRPQKPLVALMSIRYNYILSYGLKKYKYC